ncbi:MAG: hypothetical protein CR971_00315 [candidate division SR1 bacterium]|nr:MAG: hypothetical protein CR971_00315 [candidate division SR1 bacterium]
MSERSIKVGKVYKHFKGNFYQVLAVVNDSESNNDAVFKQFVIYKALTGKYAPMTWARPYTMFASEVDREKYPDVEQKYRFEEVELNHQEHKKINAFVALKFYAGEHSKQLVDGLSLALENAGMSTFVAVRDIEKYGTVEGLDMEHFMPRYSFPALLNAQLLVLEYSESGAGLGMCAGFAYSNNIPVYIVAKKGSKISTTVNSVAEEVFFYEDIAEITDFFNNLQVTKKLKLKM